ncbi:uncharacterized protein DS421_2g47920 [Arachis hypogaea]|nr:uncharacterized protein DS421_2g47920 [Arachis hypogaea]
MILVLRLLALFAVSLFLIIKRSQWTLCVLNSKGNPTSLSIWGLIIIPLRKIKNEFMTHWDGLMTKPGERILVLAATNRPFDLDEAIIGRFERRIMVGLPSVENREKF